MSFHTCYYGKNNGENEAQSNEKINAHLVTYYFNDCVIILFIVFYAKVHLNYDICIMNQYEYACSRIVSKHMCFFTCILGLLLSGGCSNKQESENLTSKAKKMIEFSKIDSATTYLNQAVFLDSTNSEAYFLLGKVKAHSKDYNLASWYLHKADQAGYILDSIIHVQVGYLEGQSIQDLYEEMNQRGVRNFELFKAMAWSLYDDYRRREALELIIQEKSKYQDKDAMLFLQAKMEYHLNDYVGSENHLDQLLKKRVLVKRDKAVCFGYKASIAYDQGNKTLTLHYLNESIKIFPMENYLRFRGTVYREMENKKSACADFRQAYEMGSIEAIDDLARYCQNEQTN